MKTSCLYIALALSVPLALVAQSASPAVPSAPAPRPPPLWNWRTPDFLVTPPRTNSAKPLRLGAPQAPLALALARTNRPAAAQELKPGIYQTLPFHGLVIVPEPHVDDRALMSSERDASMPMVKPGLQFIPWSAK